MSEVCVPSSQTYRAGPERLELDRVGGDAAAGEVGRDRVDRAVDAAYGAGEVGGLVVGVEGPDRASVGEPRGSGPGRVAADYGSARTPRRRRHRPSGRREVED
jgi:hypothetical protein